MNKFIFFQIFQKNKRLWLSTSFFKKCALITEDFFSDPSWVREILKEEDADLLTLWDESEKERDFLSRHFLWLQRLKIQVVIRGDHDFPRCFENLEDPPWILFYRGDLSLFQEKNISVVGSRDLAPHTRLWMEQDLQNFLKTSHAPVVSGGARGADYEAHLLALRLSLPTGVILPSGLGQLYPSHLMDLQDEIIEKKGVLISEFPWNAKMHKSYFHHRNRLIAAAGQATLIVQAQKRSGTMITAQQSAKIGKPVWCVPGHPKDPHFSGCLQLINEGATLVSDAHELSALWQSEIQDLTF